MILATTAQEALLSKVLFTIGAFIQVSGYAVYCAQDDSYSDCGYIRVSRCEDFFGEIKDYHG